MTTNIEPAVVGNAGALDATRLLQMSPRDLDDLFRASPAGEIPQGRGRGTAVFFPGTEVAAPVARIVRATVWQGKEFYPESHDLKNLVSPLGVPAIRAEVYTENSWLDGRACIVLDYSRGSRLFSWIRDEIREVSPRVFLGVVWGVGRVFAGRRRVLRFVLTFPSGS